jgi:HTH-type transcriptional regulator / antitoxin HigA
MNQEMNRHTENVGSIRVVKDDSQYALYLAELRALIERAPMRNTATAERLDLLAVVLEKYEEERFLLAAIDPIDAITMRMAELGYEQKDLAKTLGSSSRASEILNRKRPLSLEHIRALHSELRIPTDVLLGRVSTDIELTDDQLKKLPFNEMIKRGWFGSNPNDSTQVLRQFKEFIAKVSLGATPVFMRRSIYGGVSDSTQMTTYAWFARVVLRARENKNSSIRFSQAGLDIDFLKQVSKLSSANTGPKLAQEFLSMKGIMLVAERELPGMKLDGAVIRDDDGTPIIGLTLRHDRLDNFWFTLMHELAHLLKHFSNQSVAFVDDLANPDSSDPRENEADAIASECLIPRSIWSRSQASKSRRKDDIEALANNLCISPAIVAGRIRKDTGNWTILSKHVGQGEVRKHFTDVNWN